MSQKLKLSREDIFQILVDSGCLDDVDDIGPPPLGAKCLSVSEEVKKLWQTDATEEWLNLKEDDSPAPWEQYMVDLPRDPWLEVDDVSIDIPGRQLLDSTVSMTEVDDSWTGDEY